MVRTLLALPRFYHLPLPALVSTIPRENLLQFLRFCSQHIVSPEMVTPPPRIPRAPLRRDLATKPSGSRACLPIPGTRAGARAGPAGVLEGLGVTRHTGSPRSPAAMQGEARAAVTWSPGGRGTEALAAGPFLLAPEGPCTSILYLSCHVLDLSLPFHHLLLSQVERKPSKGRNRACRGHRCCSDDTRKAWHMTNDKFVLA